MCWQQIGANMFPEYFTSPYISTIFPMSQLAPFRTVRLSAVSWNRPCVCYSTGMAQIRLAILTARQLFVLPPPSRTPIRPNLPALLRKLASSAGALTPRRAALRAPHHLRRLHRRLRVVHAELLRHVVRGVPPPRRPAPPPRRPAAQRHLHPRPFSRSLAGSQTRRSRGESSARSPIRAASPTLPPNPPSPLSRRSPSSPSPRRPTSAPRPRLQACAQVG